MKLATITILLSICLAFSLSGQVILTVQDQPLSDGATVSADFHFYGYEDVASFQFVLQYDTSALEYAGLSFTGAIPGFDEDWFSFAGPNSALLVNEIRALYSQPTGLTLPEGELVFTMHFTSKITGSLSQHLRFWPNHTVIVPKVHYQDLSWAPLEMVFTDVLSSASAISQVSLSVFPSPGHGNKTVRIVSERPAEYLVSVFDMAGYQVFGEMCQHFGGETLLNIGAFDAGQYTVTVSDGKYFSQSPFVSVR